MVSALAVRRERAPKVGEAHERYAIPDTLALHLAHEGLDGAVHLRAARCRLNGMRRGTHWQRAAEGTYRGTIVVHNGTWGAQGEYTQGIANGESGTVEDANGARLEHYPRGKPVRTW